MTEYVRLAEAPAWSVSYPTCSVCCVDLQYEDGWLCPVCGTSWPGNASDGDTGTLYEDWSGETLEGETITEDEAQNVGIAYEQAERARLFVGLGWCEHGMIGKCWRVGCPGGKNAEPNPD